MMIFYIMAVFALVGFSFAAPNRPQRPNIDKHETFCTQSYQCPVGEALSIMTELYAEDKKVYSVGGEWTLIKSSHGNEPGSEKCNLWGRAKWGKSGTSSWATDVGAGAATIHMHCWEPDQVVAGSLFVNGNGDFEIVLKADAGGPPGAN